MIHRYKTFEPQVDENCFIAEGAHVIGRVEIGRDCSIWYNAVIRGDDNTITIGNETNIQDNAVIHVGRENETLIGEGVTIGHSAIIHGAKIGDHTLIGMGSTVLDGAVIGKDCLVGANSLVTANTVIEDGMLVLGAPAKAVRRLDEAQKELLAASAESYVQLSKEYL